jgi:hypothetical protein
MVGLFTGMSILSLFELVMWTCKTLFSFGKQRGNIVAWKKSTSKRLK